MCLVFSLLLRKMYDLPNLTSELIFGLKLINFLGKDFILVLGRIQNSEARSWSYTFSSWCTFFLDWKEPYVISYLFLVCIWESQVFLSSYNLFHLSFNILLSMWDKTEFPFSHIFFSTLINNSVISFQSKSLRYLDGDSVTILLARVSLWGVVFFFSSALWQDLAARDVKWGLCDLKVLLSGQSWRNQWLYCGMTSSPTTDFYGGTADV